MVSSRATPVRLDDRRRRDDHPAVPSIEVTTTTALTSPVLAGIRALLDDAFDGEFADEDWAHTLGGWHAIVTDDEVLVAHAAVIERTLEVDATPYRTGYVEGVATLPGRHGAGLGSHAMTAIMEVVRRVFAFGALSTDRHRFYERLGWERWRGPT